MRTSLGQSSSRPDLMGGSPFVFDGLRPPLPSHNWGWFALRGVLAIVFGIGVLLLPGLALFTLALVFAAYSFADGVLGLVSGIRGTRAHDERWPALILSGLLGIAVGVIFFFFPLLGTVAYAVLAIALVAAWAIATGVLEIVAAVRLRRVIRGEWLLFLTGALSIALALGLLALFWTAPGTTMLSVAWLIGIYAVAAGVSLLVLAYRLRRHGAR